MTLLRLERSREVICLQLDKKLSPIVVTLLRPGRSRIVICEQRDKNLSPIVVTSEMSVLLGFELRKAICLASEGSSSPSTVRQPSAVNVGMSRYKYSVMWSLIQRSSFSRFASSTNQLLPNILNYFFHISNSLFATTP